MTVHAKSALRNPAVCDAARSSRGVAFDLEHIVVVEFDPAEPVIRQSAHSKLAWGLVRYACKRSGLLGRRGGQPAPTGGDVRLEVIRQRTRSRLAWGLVRDACHWSGLLGRHG